MASSSGHSQWLICVDTGGTFTDCLARDPSGALHRAKVLSTSALRGRVVQSIGGQAVEIEHQWGACDDLIRGFACRRLDTGQTVGVVEQFDSKRSVVRIFGESARSWTVGSGTLVEFRSSEPAPILAARMVTCTPAGGSLPPMNLRLATTRGTNALLERKGAEIAMFITEGFGDLLHIGDQSRPELFALRIVKPEPLPQHVVEVPERLHADGSIARALNEAHVRAAGMRLREQSDVRVAAVALMHSHVNPSHEESVAAILRECGFEHVSVSSGIAPLIRIVPRAMTAAADAYLGPVIAGYLNAVSAMVDKDAKTDDSTSTVHMMTSAGSLNAASRFRACESLLSGPAGGVLGAATAGQASGFRRVIGFDMGGTSTDVCRCDGELNYRFEHSVGDVKLLSPALSIETVAAGGGSICDFVDGRLVVGPHSAGAEPGPACYGLEADSARLTLTDVNLLLGRLSVEQFEIPIAIDASAAALRRLVDRISFQTHAKANPNDVLNGLLDIANQRMASAIEAVSLRQGYDVHDYALLAFGGAGGQHACALADRLGIRSVIMPRDASLLSAAGLMSASIERMAQKQILQTLDSCADMLVEWIHDVARQAVADVQAEHVMPAAIDVRRVIFDVRLSEQDSTIQIDIGADDGDDIAGLLRSRFAARYAQVYGHAPPQERKPTEVESLRVVAWQKPAGGSAIERVTSRRAPASARPHQMYVDGEWREVPSLARNELSAEQEIFGPALIVDRRSSCVIDAGWRASIDDVGAIIARRIESKPPRYAVSQPQIVRLELFSHRFMSVADEMGQMLRRTALSTNVKERLDFSCTILDANGNLIANAPHLPVHLGAMGVCVRAVRDVIDMRPGDMIITNHPAFGGSHLPDITLIAPVFDDADRLIGYVANRAHHAEVGGTRPGSMPPNAVTLEEEGVVIPPMHVMRQGVPEWNRIESMFISARHPSRAVADNLADLQAQVASNLRGVSALQALARQCGSDEIVQQMTAISDRAARLARLAIDRLPRKVREAVETLDDGSPLCVRVDLNQRPMVIDCAGTAAQHRGNLNATPAIVRSAVMYVLRLLVGESLPLNEGLMREVEVRLPRGSLLDPIFDMADPASCPAVVGGNTEVSQRLVDTLLKAFDVAACSQGTMNNILFGDDHFGYYETVCGGSGATRDGPGADAVHVHMTNTRITDPEIIEHRYPVRLDRFAIRRGSGGIGRHRGGNGAIREMTFLRPMALSVLTQHRVTKPFGSHGGGDGACGRQHVIRADGTVIDLQSVDGCDVKMGDRLIVETPGGGGWGVNE